MITAIGFLGALFFGICSFPQVYQVWKTQDTKSLSKMFLILWALGEGLSFIYIVSQPIILWPIVINYVFNGLLLSYLVFKKFTLD